MNSRLDWLVLSDYYSIYVTNAPPNKKEHRKVFFFSQEPPLTESAGEILLKRFILSL